MLPPMFDEQLFSGQSAMDPQVVRSVWKSELTEAQKDELVEIGVQFWRDKGFPYITKDTNQLIHSIRRLLSFNVDKLLKEGDEIGQVNVGVDVCNSYHPKMFHVQCHKSPSVIDAFNSEKLLRRAIRKAFLTTGMCNAPALRSMLRTGGAQMPSNFNPSVAKWIWKNFCPRGGRILDPSAGWGGRALAAICTANRSYLGIDPHVAAVEGNRRMVKDIQALELSGHDLSSTDVQFKIACSEAPDGIPSLPDDHFDCIFTSPPYFDVEKYDDSPDQSYLKHGKGGFRGWVKGFLSPLIRECARVLKPDGWCLFNVSDSIRQKHNFAGYTQALGEHFMEHVHTYQLRFALRTQLRKEGKTHRFEPLFLFQKKGAGEREFPSSIEQIDASGFQVD